MKTTILIFSITVMVFFMESCRSASERKNLAGKEVATGVNSMNSLDWEGFYTGTVPCASCQGIQTTIKLARDNSYILRTKYLGTDDEGQEKTGKFVWNKAGTTVTLQGIENGPSQYLVDGERLFQLDMQGKRITSSLADQYMLKKVNSDLVEKYWKLVELNGQPVKSDEKMNGKEPHIIFKIEDNRISGSGGCNSFFGTYELLEGNRIKFSQVGATMMACIDMDVENRLMEVLNMADNYNLNDEKLTLNRARTAPLARFEVVYLK